MRLINLKNLQKNKIKKKKEIKALTFQNAERLLKGRQKVINGFKKRIVPIGKQTQ